MNYTLIILLFMSLTTCYCKDIRKYFEEINEMTAKFSAAGAEISWKTSVNPNHPNLVAKSDEYQKIFLVWQHKICNDLTKLYKWDLLNATQRRQTYLFCRGSKYTYKESRLLSNLYNELQSNYSDNNICFLADDNIMNSMENTKLVVLNTSNKNMLCLKGESEFSSIVKVTSDEPTLRYLWTIWREKVDPRMRGSYKRIVNIENLASRRNGYPDIGAVQRAEIEIPNLRALCHQLYDDILPVYKLLHGVVRFYLRNHYGEIVPERGPIPAHLLGSLWSENWGSLSGMMTSQGERFDSAVSNWTITYMAKRAEDYYRSLGLPAMTDTFWKQSVFASKYNNTRCHGTAADMFKDGDYRILYCPSNLGNRSMEDFYVLHHEMGHIQYYMAYSHQPTLFRQANSALHETIGDAIMLGVMSPQHLNRLNVINDSLLFTSGNSSEDITAHKTDPFEISAAMILKNWNREDKNNSGEHEYKDYDATDDADIELESSYFPLFDKKESSIDTILLLNQALLHLPQIPFTLLVDEFRWRYFETDMNNPNEQFWKLAQQLQGIAPYGYRGENYFDPGALYLVADHTPAIRYTQIDHLSSQRLASLRDDKWYYLANFLQYQLFATLCKAATFGRQDVDEPLPETIALNRCDLYGSRVVGKLLKDLMSRGHSQPLAEILRATVGEDTVSASALLRYYGPLQAKLERFVKRHRIPIGW